MMRSTEVGAVRERWRAEVGGCDALVADSEVVVAATGSELVAFDAVSGVHWWTIPVDGGDADIVVHAGAVYYASAESVRTIDLREGRDIDPPRSWPEPRGGHVVERDGGAPEVAALEGGIGAFEVESGLQRWWAPLDEDYVGAVGVVGHAVLINGSRGLHVLAADSGATLALVAAEGVETAPSSAMPSAGGRVFAGLADGWLVCLDAES